MNNNINIQTNKNKIKYNKERNSFRKKNDALKGKKKQEVTEKHKNILLGKFAKKRGS